ncbi:MAG TPA: hypothetical protein VLV25_06310 [Steroidobacteraceae bacterium]|nr:hypothetical protein [Steroidobacteraceae bacterium]
MLEVRAKALCFADRQPQRIAQLTRDLQDFLLGLSSPALEAAPQLPKYPMRATGTVTHTRGARSPASPATSRANRANSPIPSAASPASVG